MAYRLKLRKPLEASVRRILAEQGKRASAALTGSADLVAAVHDARRALKRMRALLRLVREGLGDDTWRAENAALRDVGRRLSGLRDADVGRQTIDALTTDAPAALRTALGKLAAMLGKEVSPDPDERRHVLASAAHDLTAVGSRLATLTLDGADIDILAAGLEAAHRRGRRALEQAEAEGSGDEAMHEVRKAVQAHWRQTNLLSAAWLDLMKARASEARQLSGLLGTHNDLALLSLRARAAGGHGLSRAAVAHIVTSCSARQDAIREEALPRARRLFAGKPRATAAAIVEAWRATAALPDRKAPAISGAVAEKSAR